MTSEQQATAVDIATGHHLYSGLMPTHGHRVAEILSDSNSEMIELTDVLAIGTESRSARIRCDEISLKKKHILLAFPKGSHEAPRRRQNNYQQKHRYGAMLVLPGYILSGILHLPPRADARMLLDDASSLPAFFGMTDVEVHSAIHDFTPKQSDVVIVRRASLEAVHLSPQPLAKPAERSLHESLR